MLDRVGADALFKRPRRRSSGVEHSLGKGEVVSSILTDGTIPPLPIQSFIPGLSQVIVFCVVVAQSVLQPGSFCAVYFF